MPSTQRRKLERNAATLRGVFGPGHHAALDQPSDDGRGCGAGDSKVLRQMVKARPWAVMKERESSELRDREERGALLSHFLT
jgi:hypothetical protein